jgi:hypothetical protein
MFFMSLVVIMVSPESIHFVAASASVGDKVARDKVGQAFRDSIRANMKEVWEKKREPWPSSQAPKEEKVSAIVRSIKRKKRVSKFLTNLELETRLDSEWCQKRCCRHVQLQGTSGMKHRTVVSGPVVSVVGGVQPRLS